MENHLRGKRIGFAMTGSFCTLRRVLQVVPRFVEAGADVTPILSETAWSTDTRFMPAAELVARLREICGREPLHSIVETEPVGPKKTLDLLVVAPATGNTLGKLAAGITDTSVTMACKAQWRNERPVLLAPSTNDARTGSAAAMRALFDRPHTYLATAVPDDPAGKPASLVAVMETLPDIANAILAAL